jgi:hypothetical protein
MFDFFILLSTTCLFFLPPPLVVRKVLKKEDMAVEKFRQLAPGLGSIEAKLYLEVGRWWLCCPFLLCVLGGVSGLISRFPVTLIEPIHISSFQLPTPSLFPAATAAAVCLLLLLLPGP